MFCPPKCASCAFVEGLGIAGKARPPAFPTFAFVNVPRSKRRCGNACTCEDCNEAVVSDRRADIIKALLGIMWDVLSD